ncbi:hypothetical protein [Algoriphagus sp. Y33]
MLRNLLSLNRMYNGVLIKRKWIKESENRLNCYCSLAPQALKYQD